MRDTNPKKAFGDKKPPLGQVPTAVLLHAAMAYLDGTLKYGFRNWRIDPVTASTYIEAIGRHHKLYENGEDLTRDTRVHNLGAIIACCGILLDAELHGTLIDDRIPSPQVCDLMHRMEKDVLRIQKMEIAREKARIEQQIANTP